MENNSISVPPITAISPEEAFLAFADLTTADLEDNYSGDEDLDDQLASQSPVKPGIKPSSACDTSAGEGDPASESEYEGDLQEGGGPRQSTPPSLTTTRLRTKTRPTLKATVTSHKSVARRRQLLESEHPPLPALDTGLDQKTSDVAPLPLERYLDLRGFSPAGTPFQPTTSPATPIPHKPTTTETSPAPPTPFTNTVLDPLLLNVHPLARSNSPQLEHLFPSVVPLPLDRRPLVQSVSPHLERLVPYASSPPPSSPQEALASPGCPTVANDAVPDVVPYAEDDDGSESGEDPGIEAPPRSPRKKVATSGGPTGRISGRNQLAIDASFKEINTIFSQLSQTTGYPTDQLNTLFLRSIGRTTSKNSWNLYQRYFAAHQAQELNRASLDPVLPAAQVTAAQRKRCRETFFSEYGELAHDILETWDEAEQCAPRTTTASHRQQSFQRFVSKLTNLVDTAHNRENTDTIFITAGNSPNEDGSLAVLYSTGNAENFFQQRCNIDGDTVLAHFKSHLYNNISLDNMPAFIAGPDMKDPGSSKPPMAARSPPKPTAGPSSSVVHSSADAPGPSANLSTRGMTLEQIIKDVLPKLVNSVETPYKTTGSTDDINLLRAAIIKCASDCDLQIIHNGQFPWKKILDLLNRAQFSLINWPEGCPLPGFENQHKGISGLKLSEQVSLWQSLATGYDYPLKFIPYSGDLPGNKRPLIIGAPPRHTSGFPRGVRQFQSGAIDHHGLHRLENSTPAVLDPGSEPSQGVAVKEEKPSGRTAKPKDFSSVRHRSQDDHPTQHPSQDQPPPKRFKSFSSVRVPPRDSSKEPTPPPQRQPRKRRLIPEVVIPRRATKPTPRSETPLSLYMSDIEESTKTTSSPASKRSLSPTPIKDKASIPARSGRLLKRTRQAARKQNSESNEGEDDEDGDSDNYTDDDDSDDEDDDGSAPATPTPQRSRRPQLHAPPPRQREPAPITYMEITDDDGTPPMPNTKNATKPQAGSSKGKGNADHPRQVSKAKPPTNKGKRNDDSPLTTTSRPATANRPLSKRHPNPEAAPSVPVPTILEAPQRPRPKLRVGKKQPAPEVPPAGEAPAEAPVIAEAPPLRPHPGMELNDHPDHPHSTNPQPHPSLRVPEALLPNTAAEDSKPSSAPHVNEKASHIPRLATDESDSCSRSTKRPRIQTSSFEAPAEPVAEGTPAPHTTAPLLTSATPHISGGTSQPNPHEVYQPYLYPQQGGGANVQYHRGPGGVVYVTNPYNQYAAHPQYGPPAHWPNSNIIYPPGNHAYHMAPTYPSQNFGAPEDHDPRNQHPRTVAVYPPQNPPTSDAVAYPPQNPSTPEDYAEALGGSCGGNYHDPRSQHSRMVAMRHGSIFPPPGDHGEHANLTPAYYEQTPTSLGLDDHERHIHAQHAPHPRTTPMYHMHHPPTHPHDAHDVYGQPPPLWNQHGYPQQTLAPTFAKPPSPSKPAEGS